MISKESFIATESKGKGHQNPEVSSVCQTGHQREPAVWAPSEAFGCRPAAGPAVTAGLLRGARGPRVPVNQLWAPAQSASGEPTGHHTPTGWRGFGTVSGRGHGKGYRGLGTGGPATASLPWTRARRRLLSHCRPRAGSHSGTIFGPPEEEEKKAKKGVAVLWWNLRPERIGACRAREGGSVGSKAPALERNWQGAADQGTRRRRWDTRPFTHTTATPRERQTASPVPAVVPKTPHPRTAVKML